MLTFYSAIVFEIVFLMIVLSIMAQTNDQLSQEKCRLFQLLFFSIIVAILAEWIGSMTVLFGNGLRQIHIHIWTKVVELSLTPVTPFLCAKILDSSTMARRWNKRVVVLLILHTGLEIFSAFSGFIFYVDGSNVFQHGPFYWIYWLAYLCGGLCVLQVGYRVGRRYQSRNKFVLVLLLLFLVCGVTVNQMDKSVKTAWLTVSIVVVLIYAFYNDMMRRIDDMTMLLNRTSYQNRLRRLHDSAILQFFDVDFLKSINNEYGHLYGDHCLQVIGCIIRDTYGRYGRCYRIGGDEFCVILSGKQLPIEEWNEAFFTAMEKRRETDPHFPHISIGYAKYEPGAGRIQEAVQIANAALYRNKERNKIRYGPLPPIQREMLLKGQGQAKEQLVPGTLDTSGLTDRIFAAFSGTSDRSYIFLCNMNTGVSRWSTAAVRYFGLPGEYMFDAARIWEVYIHPQDRQMYREDIDAVFSGHKMVHEMEYRARNRLGEYVVCTCHGVVLKGNGEAPDLFAGTINNHGIVDDVDPITSLHTYEEFSKSIHRMLKERTRACVMKLGIEHFRFVNAMYGQQGGNQVLRLLGIELQELVEGKGRVFRLEGAKFALYLYHTDEEEALEFFHNVRIFAEERICINKLKIPLRIYGGAVFLDGKHFYNDSIIHSSLIYAMRQSLETAHGGLVVSKDFRQEFKGENINLHKDIHRSAVEGCKGFFLCYQPIISLSTEKVIGAEALLRWKQEPYGLVPPDNFIPWLENDPVFIEVGNWVLRQALTETAPLRQADPDFIVNVNIANTQIEHRNFREDVLNIMAETNCPPKNLCLELTERCNRMDMAFLADELKFFRSHGITIAADDFGTGYSSLTLLLQLPIDELKVDRAFLSKLFIDPRYHNMMECIMYGSQKSGIRTCVEGVETKEQYELIASMGGDYYQGYYASKPVPIGEFLEFYQKREA